VAKVPSRQLVIDASIARAAGDTSKHPTARNCCEFLRMEKDRHWIEAALATDKRVASLDDRVRQHFRDRASKLSEVLSICWVNPNMPHEASIAWLESGAPAERSRTLGFPLPRSEE